MTGETGGTGEKAFERFSEEAYTAAKEACRELRELASENPDLLVTILDTLPGLVDSWAYYTFGYMDLVEDAEKLRRIADELPSIIVSLVSSVYGVKAGVPLAALLLIPAAPLTRALATCGRETSEPIVDPASPMEARLRATIISAQATVYRVYFAMLEALEEGEGGNLWKPKEARILHI